MQNAMDIMAMVQKTGVARQNFDVPSKTFKNVNTSFKKEFAEVKKELVQDKSHNSKAIDSHSQRTTENNAEKLAKVMSSGSPKADVKEKQSVDAVEEVLKKEAGKKPEDTEAMKELNENLQSAVEMLQQLMQTLQGVKVQDSEGMVSGLETELQGAIQKLEQLINTPLSGQNADLGQLLASLQKDLAELFKQNEILPEAQETRDQLHQLINQMSDKLNQAKTQLHHIQKQEEILVKVDERPQQILTEAVKSDVNGTIKLDSTSSEINKTDQNQQINTAATEKAAEDKDEKDSSKQGNSEASYKGEAANNTKKALTADKLNQADILNTMPQNEKLSFELNVKQLNTSHSKDGFVKINNLDVINQVIKKADIIIQGSHQEMIMKLEPESLGKLNLKLVVENGIITAKFVAESQQVKEVLEASFNQLKDALQEKGIAVQNLTVSVGQQGAEFSSGQGFEQWKKSIKLSSKAAGDYLELDDEISNINPYSYHEGKVDYRA